VSITSTYAYFSNLFTVMRYDLLLSVILIFIRGLENVVGTPIEKDDSFHILI
jgi:hypothetical protein